MISCVCTVRSRSDQSSKSTKKDDLPEQSVDFVMFKYCESILIELLDPRVVGTKGDVTEQRLNQVFCGGAAVAEQRRQIQQDFILGFINSREQVYSKF